MIPHVTLLQFLTKDVDPLLRQVRQTTPLEDLSMEVDKITLVKSYAYRLLGTYEERNNVNEEIDTFDLR